MIQVMIRLSLPVLSVLLGTSGGFAQVKDFRFEVKTLGGKTITQSQFKDNVLLVDFWGTWCPPCRDAVPDLMALYKKYKHHGLEIVGLNYNERNGVKGVREFAVKNGITYPLAMGTPAIQKQVLGRMKYPTMLFFEKGLKFDHMKTGYGPGSKKAIEKWVRQALGLDKKTSSKKKDPEDEAEEEEKVEPGRIHKPGHHDTGFAFDATDTAGKEFAFKDLRGKKVVLALTSASYEQTAVATARLLSKVLADNPSVAVLAACIEGGGPEQQAEKIRKFNEDNKVGYRTFPASIKFGRKLHRFGGLPTFLVFDVDGRLILRQENDRPQTEIAKRIQDTLDGKPAKSSSRPASKPAKKAAR